MLGDKAFSNKAICGHVRVTADEASGGDSKFRSWLEDRRIGYVVAVPSNQTTPAVAGTSRADVLVAHAPAQAWKRRSCGDGAKGPRLFDWAVAELPTYEDTTHPGGNGGCWHAARRPVTARASTRLPTTCVVPQ